MASFVDWIPAGVSLYDSYQKRKATGQATNQGIRGIDSASNILQSTADRSLSTLSSFYKQGREDIQPYQNFGLQGLEGYNKLMADPSSITSNPGYEFRFNQGQIARERSAAAKGMHLSGNTLQALDEYGQGFAMDEYDRALDREKFRVAVGDSAGKTLADLGRSVAEGIVGVNRGLGEGLGGLAVSRGEVAGAGTIGQAQNTSGGLKDLLSLYQNYKNVSGGGTTASTLAELSNAGGGSPLAGAKALFDGYGTGTWADLAAGPASSAGLSSLTAAPGTAAEFAAFGDAPFAMLSETGIGATSSAAGAGGAGGAGTGTALTGNTLAAAGVVALPMLMAAISKFGKGGSVESAKSGKLAQQLQRDAQADPSGRTAQATIDRLITNQLWPGEGNQWVISDLMKSGVVTLNTPSLYSKNSVVDVFQDPDSLLKGSRTSMNTPATAQIVALGAGLSQQEADQYGLLLKRYFNSDNAGEGGSDYRLASQQARMKQQIDAFNSRIRSGQRNTAWQTYNTLTSQGYRGDLSKLKNYLGIK